MRFITYILIWMPLWIFSQQTVELCDDTATYTYSTQSNIASTIEWELNSQYYYGNSVNITWDTPGVYTLSATPVSNNCPGSPQTITVTVKECDDLVYWVPNTFTPNGDEFNTTWGPVFNGAFDAMDFNLIVVNRWGNVIWQSFDSAATWDGTYNGKMVSDGVYIWYINFGILNSDERISIHGHVTIIK